MAPPTTFRLWICRSLAPREIPPVNSGILSFAHVASSSDRHYPPLFISLSLIYHLLTGSSFRAISLGLRVGRPSEAARVSELAARNPPGGASDPLPLGASSCEGGGGGGGRGRHEEVEVVVALRMEEEDDEKEERGDKGTGRGWRRGGRASLLAAARVVARVSSRGVACLLTSGRVGGGRGREAA